MLQILTEGSDLPDPVAAILYLDEASDRGPALEELDRQCGGALTRQLASAVIGADGKVMLFYPVEGAGFTCIVVAMRAPGASAELCGAATAKTILDENIRAISLMTDCRPESAVACFVTGLMIGSHRYSGLRSGVDQPEIALHLAGRSQEALDRIEAELEIARAVCLARELVLEPPNVLTPACFADRCHGLDANLDVEVLDAASIAALGMGGILAIARGSREEPKVAVLSWLPNGPAEQPIVLVGKGVTFDSGGLALKQKAGMERMKYDMAGAAAVATTLRVAARRRFNHNVVGIIGLVENMPGGNAVKPGDVITMMSGTTVEIENPDAEGRIILGDLLTYARSRHAPACIIDIATLTGAVETALGSDIAGLFSNDDKLAGQLVEAGKACAEPLWRLPLPPAYDPHIEGVVSDLKNMGKRGKAGAIYAALFLQRFVGKTAWAHLDIGNTGWSDDKSAWVPQGATGFGVRLLTAWLLNHGVQPRQDG